ncbi:hypothetical protein [Longimicrobium sp.]|uniref:hypothetical protein n=1 Tax=Longimicrobium sp. TaxID=2029185 RepID=UPI003B3B9EE3
MITAPKRKKLNRAKRLNLAKQWIVAYPGGSLIRGYTKWFGVSDVCAIVELRMLGVDVADARLEQAKRNETLRAAKRAERKPKSAVMEGWADADERFASLAGCTPGGAPHGIEQDSADATWDQHPAWRRVLDEMYEDDDLPF